MSETSLHTVHSLARTFASRQPLRITYRGRLKRALDVALALMMLPIALPLVLILAALVRQGGGPAFYAHRRVGRHGRPFECWKLRTMVPDADRCLRRLLAADPEARAAWREGRKLPRDPRITRPGRLLRRTSLDELPQIWNVLKGEMSLVGPRPVTADELPLYGARRAEYLALRPGLTGLWQVSGRNALGFDRRVALDVDYHDRLSLAGDLAILMRTAGAVAMRTGC